MVNQLRVSEIKVLAGTKQVRIQRRQNAREILNSSLNRPFKTSEKLSKPERASLHSFDGGAKLQTC